VDQDRVRERVLQAVFNNFIHKEMIFIAVVFWGFWGLER